MSMIKNINNILEADVTTWQKLSTAYTSNFFLHFYNISNHSIMTVIFIM